MRLVFAGTPEPAAAVLAHLIDSDHTVEAVITRPDARKGRGRTLHPSPVAELAEKHGIEVLKAAKLTAEDEGGAVVRQRLAEIAPDCIPVVAYGALVPKDLLDVVEHGWVNLHFSVLPQWRGAAPVQAAIAAGQKETGATVFRIDEGLDTGPVLSTMTTTIDDDDTTETLLSRLAEEGGQLMVDTFSALERGDITLKEQVGEASYAHKITTDDARIDFTRCAHDVSCHIRAVTPAPGAWCEMGDQRIKLGPVTEYGGELDVVLDPGLMVLQKKQVLVGTGTTPVVLSTIQVPGKKFVPAADWGRSQQPGEELIQIDGRDYPYRRLQ
ncbi:methionyl-tRNA formyltransferase [Corynebacterium aquilae]|uniref:methionyl-tRNA formyltransferase n=1 Tax=Corynebacterium aquilae TaxID=203263 RepID=UPI0009534410|nr:methionyl-tRNA formyltransferase [Corynebacterium aquilae]